MGEKKVICSTDASWGKKELTRGQKAMQGILFMAGRRNSQFVNVQLV